MHLIFTSFSNKTTSVEGGYIFQFKPYYLIVFK